MAETQDKQADIVVVGGGPVGLAAACLLADTGLYTILVDAGQAGETIAELSGQAETPRFDARVSALTVASEQILGTIGAWEAIKGVRVCPYGEMEVWDGEGTGQIHFSAADIHADTLGHIVENRLVTAALQEQAALRDNLEILAGVQVASIDPAPSDGQGVCLGLADGGFLYARLLVGADGANSMVREQAGFRLRQWDYGHEAIVTTVKTEKPHQFTAWQRFMRTGPLAFLPLYLPGTNSSLQNYCSIVWSCVTEEADGIRDLDADAFNQALGEAFEFRLGRILESAERASFPLWQRHATDYVMPSIALVGDAAHTIHPLAGQGVNLGFADVQALSEVIAAARDRQEDWYSHQVLSRYQRRRKGQNMGTMVAMEGFKRLFASEDLALTWLRNAGLKLTDRSPLVKHRLMREAMGL